MTVKLTEKIIEKITSNGRISIPKKWREILLLNDDSFVEMQLIEEKEIVIKRKTHPLEIDDTLFDGIPPFTEEELEEAKQSIFPAKKWSKKDNAED